MSLYAEHPARRTRQLIGDAAVVAWVAAWIWAGVVVHDLVAALAAPGRTMADAGTSLEQGLRGAGDGVAEVPLIGDELRAPLDAAGDAAGTLTQAGVDLQEGVAQAAVLAGWSVALWPVLLVAGTWVALRVRFARRSASARRLVAAGTDLDLFALRALARAPLTTLSRVSDDPAGDWRRGDETVVRALAALELRHAGVRLPPA
ncbi:MULTISPECIES: hypothetical protein [unclassified Actinotalea]|uniref:hypothetical protein n=1 Tax=unclassified Actinotalea TaxID=2638618 RepID=UPI0015F54BE6|nr:MULTISPECIES: hypothetical protein [unclassified Actinotalea]